MIRRIHRIRILLWSALVLVHLFLSFKSVVSFIFLSPPNHQRFRIKSFLHPSSSLIKHTKRRDSCHRYNRHFGKVDDDDDDDYYLSAPRSASYDKNSRQGKRQVDPSDDAYYEENYADKTYPFQDPLRPVGENQKLARYPSNVEFYYGDEDDNYYEEEEEEDEKVDDDTSLFGGNFWSNPKGGIDRSMRPRPPPSPRLTQPRRRKTETTDPRTQRRKRTPVRSDTMTQAPLAAKDLYERLFWYGFDPDDSDQIGDKTVFGGTKGKFNGLAYLQASEIPRRPIRSRQQEQRQLPPSTRRRQDNYYEEKERYEDEYQYVEEFDSDDEEEDEFYDEEAQIPEAKTNRPIPSTRTNVTPPEDSPNPRNERQTRSQPERRRRRPREYDVYEEEDQDTFNGRDWVSKQVSSWFSGTNDDNDYEDDIRGRQERRRQRPGRTEWSPFNVLDAFLGVKRDELAYKAEVYDSKMGIGPKPRFEARTDVSKRQRRRQARENPRRPGYAYRYNSEDEMDDEEATFVVDIDPISRDETSLDTGEPAETDQITETVDDNRTNSGRVKELTWEERALAVERVPPADIPGWGPSGELPFDARTKAIMDALEDIQVARQKLEASEKKETLAKEEITILKVDAELQRRQLEQSRSDARLAQERLRQIELEIDDASRALRRARTRVQLARDQLEELQVRHWAVLGFYNPDQAEEKVAEALAAYRLSESTARPMDDLNTLEQESPGIERSRSKDSSSYPRSSD